ncbi:MAG: hypothetical protein CM15mP22_0280 [Gammaproteobacteria bacterium]|nr:MAG: hypothetical protein CM15mP22_0280 [Gammaproteobacteria bacterium]
MQLDQALKELIYTNDCVTIPNFGSFIANKFPHFTQRRVKVLSPFKAYYF